MPRWSTFVDVEKGQPIRYRSADEDSARWHNFDFRAGDIVISTRSKSGTTWMQMICALLIFQSPDLPAPLAELSPWIDWIVLPEDELLSNLASQRHRRFVKTHTPLDGLPEDNSATFIVVARHPLDAAVSLYHQGTNIDRKRVAALTGKPHLGPQAALPSLEHRLRDWIGSDVGAQTELDSFNGVFHHLTDAWSRKHQSNVILVHYADLLGDLTGEMRRIASELKIELSGERIAALAHAATFRAMKADGDNLAPDPVGVLKEKSQFFRAGRSGAGIAAASAVDLAAYNRRATKSAPPELLEWLHR